ncbi:MAG TPA: hypothetical protein VKE53_06445, partial [Pseudolabrys sp.]|nr:hypothetical protein [Pseudolabrys sp.]
RAARNIEGHRTGMARWRNLARAILSTYSMGGNAKLPPSASITAIHSLAMSSIGVRMSGESYREALSPIINAPRGCDPFVPIELPA